MCLSHKNAALIYMKTRQLNHNTGSCFRFNLHTIVAKETDLEIRHIYNLGHNILRLFDVLPNFPFTTNETNRDY